MKRRADKGRHESGSVLILAVWVLMVLSALAMAVGHYVSANLQVASWLRDATAARYAAREGVAHLCLSVLSDTNGWDAETEAWADPDEVLQDVYTGSGIYSVTHTEVGADRVVTNFGLMDEERLININTANADVLTALFTLSGGMDSGSAKEVAAAIMDWRDPDDEQLTGGAESGYYAGLSRPRPCRNGPFQTLNELLLVKGVTEERFQAVAPFVTIYGGGKVNLNTARPEVLKILATAIRPDDPRIGERLARKLASFRESGGAFEASNPGDIARVLMDSVEVEADEAAVLSGMMRQLTLKATCFRGTVTGRAWMGDEVRGSAVGRERRVTFVFDRETRSIREWYER
jgi:general secretion pathway protein K